ncbi:MAG: glycosyltransferase family 9 protein, partial [Endomicrobiales bacterium]
MLNTDCVHFLLDRPCSFHKQNKQLCDTCAHYASVTSRARSQKNILIVKLGAMGDVLRTTFLLPGIVAKWPGARITWLVAAGSEPVLQGNPHLNCIWSLDNTIYNKLSSHRFDIAINLDLSPESLMLTRAALATTVIGFTLDEKRRIHSSNTFASRWLEMSGNDILKKNNISTYQHWMARIVGLPRDDYEIYTPLPKSSVKKAAAFVRRHGLTDKKIIGVNPGAGKRWKLKRWTSRGYRTIITRLCDEGYTILLLGGKDEEDILTALTKKMKHTVINSGANNSIPDFFALINLCSVIITGDTLALHAALGLKKKVVALFGPTSAPEICLYNRGVKVISPIDCVCCYRQSCEKKPTCMDMISSGMVLQAVHACL